ncbi:Ig-like domain-containing protein [Pontibacter sp. 13R65]|uniref:Ig-like domain-containing protein n=1 Tax=Pontibacter sp. 13R65 TaxID=3127458 RepID=UPI00301C2DB4
MQCSITFASAWQQVLLLVTVLFSTLPQAIAQGCPPVSTLPCNQIQASLPVNLTFNSSVSGTITDRNGVGTGFRMIAPYSGTRLSADGTPSNTSVPGYERSKLTVSSGTLKLVTNKGIAHLANDNQLNTLGVQVDSRNNLQIDVILLNPYNGTSSQQAGLWFGLHDKTYLKLVVSANKVEFRKEINNVSGSSDQRITAAITGLNTKIVRLRLLVNAATNTAEGFYSTDGTNYLNVGAAYATKSLSIANMELTTNVAYAGIFATHRNASTPVTYTFDNFSVKAVTPSLNPYVTAVRPANGATDVPLDQSMSVDLAFPSGKSIDGSTVNSSTVELFEVTSTGLTKITGAAVNSTAAGDAITLSATLTASTTYEFRISDQVKDLNGYTLVPFQSRFQTTTSTPDTPSDLKGVSFSMKTLIDNSFGTYGFTTLAIGPDNRLYAVTSGGKIERWDINADGTLRNRVTISPFGSTMRLLIGFRFDPSATATNLIAWMSHSSGAFSAAPDWSGKITRINLNTPASPQLTDYVVNLPRSYKDHSTNSIDFGPDGALYFTQGSNTAMGAPDAAWGNRPERVLTAAVLRLDIARARQLTLPIDAKTRDGGGTYIPTASGAPLTVYASGIRNAYDLVWHSNGNLYVPTNGSAAGGNTPELKTGTIWSNGQTYTGPTIPAMTDVRDTQNDYLFRVRKGGYYGHPNQFRKEYILNGGNPTSAVDPGEVVWTANGKTFGYPVGTPKEPNYRGWSYDFGLNISPNGIIEYKSNAFNGKLKGRLLVCRFSGGDDIIILQPGGTSQDIIGAVTGSQIPGLRKPFANPLDIVEDVRTGNLYITEYYDGNGKGKPYLTLLKADQPATISAIVTTQASTISPESEDMEVYPNPAAGGKTTLELRNLSGLSAATISIVDATGRLLQSQTVNTDEQGSARTEIVFERRLSPGLYIIRAHSSTDEVRYRKLLVP